MRSILLSTLCIVTLLGSTVLADPAPVTPSAGLVHISTPSSAHTDGGSDVRLPAGYFVDEASWAALDTETKRLQTAETRLTAENTSLISSAASVSPGWYVLGLALVGGVALGWVAHDKL